MNSLIIYKSKYNKVRLGSDSDGGYVVADIDGYDALFSCGINDDVSFENAFLNKHDVVCYSYDGTIERLPDGAHRSIQFVKLNIGADNTVTTTDLDAETSAYSNIFLKMDIESHEFRWLNSVSKDFLLRFKQIVMEFHLPFTNQDYTGRGYDIDMPIMDKVGVFQKLASTHTLIHLHANNCCGMTTYKGVACPNVFECTFVRKDVQDGGLLNDVNLPTRLDSKNLNRFNDISLRWAPFVNK